MPDLRSLRQCLSICINMTPWFYTHKDLGEKKSGFVAMADPLNTVGLSFGQFFRSIKGCIMST